MRPESSRYLLVDIYIDISWYFQSVFISFL